MTSSNNNKNHSNNSSSNHNNNSNTSSSNTSNNNHSSNHNNNNSNNNNKKNSDNGNGTHNDENKSNSNHDGSSSSSNNHHNSNHNSNNNNHDKTNDKKTEDTDETCLLKCQNGGTCAKGKADLSSSASMDGDFLFSIHKNSKDIHHNHDHHGKDKDLLKHFHCECPSGYHGVECELQGDLCGEGENKGKHICLNGSKCVSNNKQHSCDCSPPDEEEDDTTEEDGGGNSKTNSSSSSSSSHRSVTTHFTGKYCEHKATDICTIPDSHNGNKNHNNDKNKNKKNHPVSPMYFCVNGGVCKDYIPEVGAVNGGTEHPGCTCDDGWTGIDCSIPSSSSSSRSNHFLLNKDELLQHPTFGFAAVMLLVAITSTIIFYCCARSRRRRMEESGTTNSSALFWRKKQHNGDGEEGDGLTRLTRNPRRGRRGRSSNISPRAGKASGEFPTLSAHRSSSQVLVDDFPTLAQLPPPPLSPNADTLTESTLNDTFEDEEEYNDDYGQEEIDEEDVYDNIIKVGPPRDEDGHALHEVNII